MKLPGYEDVIEASKRINDIVHRTPVLTSSSLNEIAGCEIYFKCENFQRAGSFKMRGASNSVFQLSDDEAAKGVATHSSGNFAQALALAAKLRGIKAEIVMPRTAPKAKVEAVRGYGGNITFCEPTLEARETTLNEIIDEKGCTFLHPYDNFNVISGQGTAAKEMLEDIPMPDIVMAPVGGGGLISGTSLAAKGISEEIIVTGAEPAGADDARKSMKLGYIVPSVNPDTIADGLLTSLGKLTFPIMQRNVTKIFTVNDEMIIKAMRLIWQRMKIIVEPSAAVPFAVILDNKLFFKDKKAGVILSGGNLDLEKLPWTVNE